MKHLFKRVVAFAAVLCVTMGLVSVPAKAATTSSINSVAFKVVGGGDFVKGESSAKVAFRLNVSKPATVYIENANGTVAYTKKYSSCKANQVYSFTWNGKKSNGQYVKASDFKVKVVVGKSSKYSKAVKFYTTNDFADGNGSEKNPYIVETTSQFNKVYRHTNCYFKQTKTLDYKGKEFVPGSTSNKPFTGVYDGNGKSIINVNYSKELSNIGVFRVVNRGAEVKNLTVKSSKIHGAAYTGAIAGSSKGKITNCKSIENEITATHNFVGGIVGKIDFEYNHAKVTDCESKNVTCLGNAFIGGIAGDMRDGELSNCTASSVKKEGKYVGGLVGETSDYSVLKNNVVHDEKVSYKNAEFAGKYVGFYMDEAEKLEKNSYYGSLTEDYGYVYDELDDCED